MEKNGQIEGPEIEIIEAIARKINMVTSCRVLPFKRCLAEMKDGSVDIMTGLLRKQEREDYIFYIDPPYKGKSNKAFYLLRGNEKKLAVYKDLHKLKVGVKRGAKYFPSFDNDSKIDKLEVNSYRQNIKKLLDKRIDTFIITASQGDYLIQNLGYNEEIMKASYGYNKANNVFIGVSRKSGLMDSIEQVETIIREMIETGEFAEIIENYFIRNNLPLPDYR